MLRKSIQIQNNVISEESRLVVARGWVGGVGDQEHEANVGSSLYVLILIPLMLFWIHTCVRPYWIAHFRRGVFFFFKPLLYIHEAAIKAHRVKDMKHRFPSRCWQLKPLVPRKVHTPVPHAGCPWCARAVMLPARVPGILRLWKWETLISNRW